MSHLTPLNASNPVPHAYSTRAALHLSTPAPTSTAPPLTASNLSDAEEAPRAFESNGLTNRQGLAARLALGSGQNHHGVGDIGGNTGDITTLKKTVLAKRPRVGDLHDGSLKTQGADKLDPTSPATRLADLNGVSQLDDNADTFDDENRCGASSLVAGVYYAKGTDGLRGLVKDMERYAKKNKISLDAYGGSKELKEHLKTGQLSKDDLNRIGDNLHSFMLAKQEQVQAANGVEDYNRGIGSNVLKDFALNSPTVQKSLVDGRLDVGLVDTDGKDGGNHYVLSGQQDGKPFVYDPYSIKGSDGSLQQVTFDADRVRLYREAASK